MQTSLHLPVAKPRKRPKKANKHGGKRPGAGRPAKGPRPSERHEVRARVTRHTPVHVVMRTLPNVPNLRSRAAYAAIRDAMTLMLVRELNCTDPAKRFRIVHFSIQRTHLHAIVEAHDQYALAAGMQVLQIAIARRINRAFARTKGLHVFADRYHAVVLSSPRQMRNTLAYVLNNWRHHREDRGKTWTVDPYSTAWQFDGWRERVGTPFTFRVNEAYDPLPVWLPRSWLLRLGWRRHARLIALGEVPGGRE